MAYIPSNHPSFSNHPPADVPDDTECPVCLSTIVKAVMATCGHSFCENCSNELKKDNAKKIVESKKVVPLTCPTCREEVPLNFFPNHTLRNVIAAQIQLKRSKLEASILPPASMSLPAAAAIAPVPATAPVAANFFNIQQNFDVQEFARKFTPKQATATIYQVNVDIAEIAKKQGDTPGVHIMALLIGYLHEQRALASLLPAIAEYRNNGLYNELLALVQKYAPLKNSYPRPAAIIEQFDAPAKIQASSIQSLINDPIVLQLSNQITPENALSAAYLIGIPASIIKQWHDAVPKNPLMSYVLEYMHATQQMCKLLNLVMSSNSDHSIRKAQEVLLKYPSGQDPLLDSKRLQTKQFVEFLGLERLKKMCSLYRFSSGYKLSAKPTEPPELEIYNMLTSAIGVGGFRQSLSSNLVGAENCIALFDMLHAQPAVVPIPKSPPVPAPVPASISAKNSEQAFPYKSPYVYPFALQPQAKQPVPAAAENVSAPAGRNDSIFERFERIERLNLNSEIKQIVKNFINDPPATMGLNLLNRFSTEDVKVLAVHLNFPPQEILVLGKIDDLLQKMQNKGMVGLYNMSKFISALELFAPPDQETLTKFAANSSRSPMDHIIYALNVSENVKCVLINYLNKDPRMAIDGTDPHLGNLGYRLDKHLNFEQFQRLIQHFEIPSFRADTMKITYDLLSFLKNRGLIDDNNITKFVDALRKTNS